MTVLWHPVNLKLYLHKTILSPFVSHSSTESVHISAWVASKNIAITSITGTESGIVWIIAISTHPPITGWSHIATVHSFLHECIGTLMLVETISEHGRNTSCSIVVSIPNGVVEISSYGKCCFP